MTVPVIFEDNFQIVYRKMLIEYFWQSGRKPQITIFLNLPCVTADNTSVPMQFADPRGVITLNLSFNACVNIKFNMDEKTPSKSTISFGTMFSGKHHDIMVPLAAIMRIHNRDNLQESFYFELSKLLAAEEKVADSDVAPVVRVVSEKEEDLLQDEYRKVAGSIDGFNFNVNMEEIPVIRQRGKLSLVHSK